MVVASILGSLCLVVLLIACVLAGGEKGDGTK